MTELTVSLSHSAVGGPMTLLVACPSSTALTRWANVREQTVSPTFFSTGAAWTTISVLESPPRITMKVCTSQISRPLTWFRCGVSERIWLSVVSALTTLSDVSVLQLILKSIECFQIDVLECPLWASIFSFKYLLASLPELDSPSAQVILVYRARPISHALWKLGVGCSPQFPVIEWNWPSLIKVTWRCALRIITQTSFWQISFLNNQTNLGASQETFGGLGGISWTF